jgi:hypothetical protein
MSTPNNHHNNKNRHNDFFMPVFIMLNGMSTGLLIRCARDMINNGYDNTTMMAALLYLLVCIRTGERIYQIHQQNKNNNDKQR